MLGEQFMVGEEICGAVVSIRFQVSLYDRFLFICVFYCIEFASRSDQSIKWLIVSLIFYKS